MEPVVEIDRPYIYNPGYLLWGHNTKVVCGSIVNGGYVLIGGK